MLGLHVGMVGAMGVRAMVGARSSLCSSAIGGVAATQVAAEP